MKGYYWIIIVVLAIVGLGIYLLAKPTETATTTTVGTQTSQGGLLHQLESLFD